MIFSGKEYITYDPRGPIYMAYNLTRYTYDEDIQQINAAMVWGEQKKFLEKITKLFKKFINFI